MTYELVQFSVDLLAPGATLSPALVQWYAGHDKFHSRRTLYPLKPLRELVDMRVGKSVVKEDFFHIRVTAIGEISYGLVNGKIDSLLARDAVGIVFGDAEMERIAAVAMNLSQPYSTQINRTFASWLDLYTVEKEAVRFVRRTSMEEIARLLNEAPKT